MSKTPPPPPPMVEPEKPHRPCPWWLAFSFDNPLRRMAHNPAKVLAPYVKPGMKTADFGCGMGHFTLGMARLVGEGGLVYAVDVQQKMLDTVMKRAGRQGLEDRIRPVLCPADGIGIGMTEGPLDFALAFWMVHETPSAELFFRQVAGILKPGGNMLMGEPAMHVRDALFFEEIQAAERAGFASFVPNQIFMTKLRLLVVQ